MAGEEVGGAGRGGGGGGDPRPLAGGGRGARPGGGGRPPAARRAAASRGAALHRDRALLGWALGARGRARPGRQRGGHTQAVEAGAREACPAARRGGGTMIGGWRPWQRWMVARRLARHARREGGEPPADLLRRLREDIPASPALLRHSDLPPLAGGERRGASPRWLAAACLAPAR